MTRAGARKLSLGAVERTSNPGPRKFSRKGEWEGRGVSCEGRRCGLAKLKESCVIPSEKMVFHSTPEYDGGSSYSSDLF